uniref:Auxin response factor n=1 Tax=Brassica oleracea var. oleracea TaxID=109376 RepID=A0A0D3D8S9_BRAOL
MIINLYFLENNQLGTPQRHLFTSGWNDFAKRKDLDVGDSFVFLRGENGESRVGIRKAAIHQQHNKPSSLISKQSMHHVIVATALNAVKRKCMFVVFYKPRSSQFLVNFDKFIDGVNKKFSIGSRFLMKFEGRDFNEIRYNEMKLQQFQDLIKYLHGRSSLLIHSSNILKSVFRKNKRQREIHDFGSNMWVPTLTQGQEIGQSSIQSLMSYSFPTMSKPNYNEQMVQAVKETPTTTATTRFVWKVP